LETTVEVGPEFRVRRVAGRGERADDDLAARREEREALGAQVAQTAEDTVAEDGVPDGSTDHEADPDRDGRGFGSWEQDVHHQGGTPAAPAAPRDASQVVTAGETV
jgi:hypothetical protein